MVGPLWMRVDKRVIDVLTPGQEVVYQDLCYLTPEALTHDVPNCGYHMIVMDGERLFYATDTATLDGVEAERLRPLSHRGQPHPGRVGGARGGKTGRRRVRL